MSTIPRAEVGKARKGRGPLKLPKDAETIGCGSLKLSKRGVWRAAVLIAVHVLIAIHIIHWKVAGRTITPVEPSESMQTLELGYVNAGFVLFIALILSTLIFGRFFCGWGCHVVALQDLCGWMLKKVGLKPKPFRSRLLVFVPLFAAFYMFLWPTILRLLEGRAFPGFQYHFQTESFWATFPGLWIALLTFGVCGFLIVFLLGNKGFCTYGCPYGAIFYQADRVAPGKIRVTDACNNCGHCTATCTSNVRVHEEVKRYGMVVDSGCMKCMDCVSVCPNDALYFGFGKPSLGKRAVTKDPKPARKYDFTWGEEIGLAALFILCFYAFRGLYDGVPFLLAIGLSSICAFLLLQGARLFYSDAVRVQHKQLRIGKKNTVWGWVGVISTIVLAAFVVHSALWQVHWHEGNRLYAKAQELSAEGTTQAEEYAKESAANFEWCRSFGLFRVAQLDASLGTAYMFLGDNAKGQSLLYSGLELNPNMAGARRQLAASLATSGKREEALAELEKTVQTDPNLPGVMHEYAEALASSGKTDEAIAQYEKILKVNPKDVDAAMGYGLLLAQSDKLDEAVKQLSRAVAFGSGPQPHYNLGLVFAESGRNKEAKEAFLTAARIDPQFINAHVALGRLVLMTEGYPASRQYYDAAFRLSPNNPKLLMDWALEIKRKGALDEALQDLIRKPADDLESWYKAVFLYRARGDDRTAAALFGRLKMRNPNLPVP